MSATRAPKGHRSGLTFYSKPFIGCFFYNDGRGVGDDNSNEGDRNLKWFVIFLPHTSRHIGITGILDHNSDLS